VFVPLLICFLIVGIAHNIISMTMKFRLIDDGVEAKWCSWWSRDFREVQRTYRERYPNSLWPEIDRYVGYLVYALFAAVLLTGAILKG
jgi:hypothetical protein